MKISIITAVRNAESQIGVTLRSVREQRGVDIEHIVVDGGSNDRTLEVVRSLGGHVARVLSEPDDGIYDAFNKGLALVTGEVVAFLNAGDAYTSNSAVATMHDRLASEALDAVFGDVMIVSGAADERIVRRYRSGKFAPWRLAYGFMPAHPTLFVCRSVYERIGHFDTSYEQAGDFEFCVRAFVKHGIRYGYVPEVIVRMPTGGVSNSGLKSKLINSREMRLACQVNGVRTNRLKLSLRLPIKAIEMLFTRSW